MRTNRIPCPVHGGGDANCALWRDERGRPHAKCWSYGCDPRAILAALGETAGEIPTTSSYDTVQSVTAARRIWDESRAAKETIVQIYLRSRGIMIDPPSSLHYHPALKHPTGARTPAMVACVEDRNGRFVGVHRTWLTLAGSKTKLDPVKAALGPISGCAVRLAPNLNDQVILAEGIETALSVLQATGIPTWAGLSATNLPHVTVPPSVNTIIIAADNDVAGGQAAEAAARNFVREGRRVKIAEPHGANDFNDLIMGR